MGQKLHMLLLLRCLVFVCTVKATKLLFFFLILTKVKCRLSTIVSLSRNHVYADENHIEEKFRMKYGIKGSK